MQDAYRIAHFDLLKAERTDALTPAEDLRIRETAAMVPQYWHRVLDVGCGDGRVSQALLARGCEVVGIDWSAKSVAHFPGPTRVCDIRASWPFEQPFDGAICCEVLEHLELPEANKVIANLKTFTRQGFLITVPAREPLNANMVECNGCGRPYHIWGHCQRFRNWEDVDAMIQERALLRKFIAAPGIRPSERLGILQNRLGFAHWAPTCLCPHCGEPLRKQHPPRFLNRIANRGVAALQRLGSRFRQPVGWFGCLYGPSPAVSRVMMRGN